MVWSDRLKPLILSFVVNIVITLLHFTVPNIIVSARNENEHTMLDQSIMVTTDDFIGECFTVEEGVLSISIQAYNQNDDGPVIMIYSLDSSKRDERITLVVNRDDINTDMIVSNGEYCYIMLGTPYIDHIRLIIINVVNSD
jgi:hypothetical protein